MIIKKLFMQYVDLKFLRCVSIDLSFQFTLSQTALKGQEILSILNIKVY